MASLDTVASVLQSWGLSLTEAMLQNMEAERQRGAGGGGAAARRSRDPALPSHPHPSRKPQVQQLAKGQRQCQKEVSPGRSPRAGCKASCSRRTARSAGGSGHKCERRPVGKAELTLQVGSRAWLPLPNMGLRGRGGGPRHLLGCPGSALL